MEWPPHSGKRVRFPEIDQAIFFAEADARRKINPAPAEFIARLQEALQQNGRGKP
jgi:predicted NUDIX family NTP pyrophosphohydrolase